GDSLVKIWGYRQLVSSLEALRTTSYDSSNPEHEQKLLKLWSLLQPKVQLQSRISKQWQDIGFQGDDPSTDFRGMGLLGLENLLFFSETYPSTTEHVLLRSQHPIYG
ncbi:UNVERIFIED_CONTAM: hypothetical protein GTU68_015900, partial [Idotea baltica]|nr:hypothetical protein [Idotea baltica]